MNEFVQTKAEDWSRIDKKLEKLLNSFIENDISPIANAAMNEKQFDVKFQVPKKVPLPEVSHLPFTWSLR